MVLAVRKPNGLERPLGPGCTVPTCFSIEQGQRDVAKGGCALEKVELLKHKPDQATPCGGPRLIVRLREIGSLKQIGSAVGLVEQAENVEQRRFS
jgi:hypothetical protein